MITIKSAKQVEKMRASAKVTKGALELLEKHIKPAHGGIHQCAGTQTQYQSDQYQKISRIPIITISVIATVHTKVSFLSTLLTRSLLFVSSYPNARPEALPAVPLPPAGNRELSYAFYLPAAVPSPLRSLPMQPLQRNPYSP